MDEPTLHELAQRLSRAERELRRLKWIGGLVLAGVLGLTVMGLGMGPFEPMRIVEAQKYLLLDSSGMVQAILGPTPHLLFGEGPGLRLYDSKGDEGLTVITDDGKLQLMLHASDTRQAAWFALEASQGSLVFAHKNQRKGGASIGLEEDGSLIMRLAPEDEKPRVELGVQADGTPKLVFRDRDGNTIWKAP